MEHYLLITKSVTQAQRIVTILVGKGMRGTILRAPAVLNPKGCSYAVRIDRENIMNALEVLRMAGIQSLQIYEKRGQSYREVSL